MGGTKDSMPLMVVAYVSAVLIGCAWSWEGACLQDGWHKPKPGPEPNLRDCALYRENSCCSQEHIEDISGYPAAMMGNESWDWCGSLSPSCESFLKRVACFLRCSPDAMLWALVHPPDTIQATPLCRSFCTNWFEACKNDMTCARNWTTDWAGVNCTGPCVPFHQMYKDESDLCNHMMGDAFMTVEDQEDVGDGGPCCLTLSVSDRAVINSMQGGKGGASVPKTTQKGPRPVRSCHRLLPPQARKGGKNAAVSKRSVAKDDAEGSGSGF
ncbi:riboflavin-binding protein-like [Anguilla anguilla]|uniref:riboflavin-binding protein-like n=1 Tax=Anguilla anguilla TaxID=7936 RepID=UPI0015AA5030|nr:riboflavin-binding protein-like [Anguilla anguilla]